MPRAAVLLVHGWPVTALHWRHLLPALREAGLDPYAVTLPGLGAPGPGPFDKETLARGVMDLADRWGVGSFGVVGHDWGGTVAYLLARDHPERVTSLVVEEEVPPGIAVTLPGDETGYPRWHSPLLRTPGVAEQLLRDRAGPLRRLFLTQSAGRTALEPAVLEAYLAAYEGQDLLDAEVVYYRTAAQDARAVLERSGTPLALPVLTVGGSDAMGTAVRDAFARLGEVERHLEVAGAGHYPVEQRPEVVVPAVVAHLARAGSA